MIVSRFIMFYVNIGSCVIFHLSTNTYSLKMPGTFWPKRIFFPAQTSSYRLNQLELEAPKEFEKKGHLLPPLQIENMHITHDSYHHKSYISIHIFPSRGSFINQICQYHDITWSSDSHGHHRHHHVRVPCFPQVEWWCAERFQCLMFMDL